jgi:hypothetical protein
MIGWFGCRIDSKYLVTNTRSILGCQCCYFVNDLFRKSDDLPEYSVDLLPSIRINFGLLGCVSLHSRTVRLLSSTFVEQRQLQLLSSPSCTCVRMQLTLLVARLVNCCQSLSNNNSKESCCLRLRTIPCVCSWLCQLQDWFATVQFFTIYSANMELCHFFCAN